MFTFWSELLQCFGVFVADVQCNRHKGIVVRLALRAIADDRVQFAMLGSLRLSDALERYGESRRLAKSNGCRFEGWAAEEPGTVVISPSSQ
jgi:hypothetical protein